MSREDWLIERRRGIGGSDAAAVVGLSKWATPYTVWCDKTGRLPDKEDSEAMRQGRDLEDYVARRWMEATGKTVRRDNAIIRNEQYPFAHANIDRSVVGERAGLECKTTSALNLKTFRGMEFPEQYYAQCVHYLAVTGYDRWYLAVLVLGREFLTFVLERDEAEIDALMGAEADFWRYVETDTAPPIGGTEADGEAVATVYAESRGGDVELFGRGKLLDEREALRRQKAALDERISEIENIIKLDMGTAETAGTDGWRVTWRMQSGRKTFAAARLAHDHPEINVNDYYDIGKPTRVFRVTKEKGA